MKNLLISDLLTAVAALGDHQISRVSVELFQHDPKPHVFIHCRTNAALHSLANALQLAPPRAHTGNEYAWTEAHRVFTEAQVSAYGEQRKLTDEEKQGRGAA